MMNVISIILILGLSAGLGWLLSRGEKPYYKWKMALLILFCLVGGVLGSLVLGWLENLTVKYLYFNILAVLTGAWLAHLLFKRLF